MKDKIFKFAWFCSKTRTRSFAIQFTKLLDVSNYIADINNDTNGGNPDPQS